MARLPPRAKSTRETFMSSLSWRARSWQKRLAVSSLATWRSKATTSSSVAWRRIGREPAFWHGLKIGSGDCSTRP